MKKEIIQFIKENKIASISCVDRDHKPYCFHCFYVFDEINNLLFFKSSLSTHHSKLLSNNPNIAGSILPDKMDFMALKGIQFTGTIIQSNFPHHINPELYYHKKLPLALAKPGHVWFAQLEMVKMSDNTNIFGKKLKWERSELVNI
ncbi:MAG: pyridoxamine 5'-phosphate oxidase family protein [Pyrinomonadaceae bacterium]|nr:pyridoxamine 5'-phosphate oxidase family protein [Sphingobacteriaceae bacterium]